MTYISFCSDIDRNLQCTVFKRRKETFWNNSCREQSMFCVRCNCLEDNCTKLYHLLTIASPCVYLPCLSIFVPVIFLLLMKNNFRRIILRLTTPGRIYGVSINRLPVPCSEWVQSLHCEYTDDYRPGRNNFRRYIETPHQSIYLSSPCNYDMITYRNWLLSSLLLV